MIVPQEIELLHSRGVARIFSPEDGQRLGLPGMINMMIRECDVDLAAQPPASFDGLYTGEPATLARALTLAEAGTLPVRPRRSRPAATVPVLGITGTGGSGKSSLTDELVRRFRLDQEDKLRIAVLAVDPTRRKGGGALLGDRIRMNSLAGDTVFFRSMATRGAEGGLPERLGDVIGVLKAAGFDLVIVETPGIGQGDAAIVPFVDHSLYVMTPEFGAASQLEKIDMLDFADVVAINKFERRGGEDARRDVGRQLVRNREEFGATWEDMPVFGTSAATFNDEGVTALYQHLRGVLAENGLTVGEGRLPRTDRKTSAPHAAVIPAGQGPLPGRRRRDRARLPRGDRRGRRGRTGAPAPAHGPGAGRRGRRRGARRRREGAARRRRRAAGRVAADRQGLLGRRARGARPRQGAAHGADPRDAVGQPRSAAVALPRYTEDAELLRFLRSENLPGRFPFTAGVFPFKREGEDPARMFAGEGDAFRTNRRFQVLSADSDAKRLSTAFDSVTLYGRDPDTRPDVYGKVGTSGVSIATLEDMKVLYGGFDLCSPTTSVSMTINGPAPTILAFYLNTAIDQRVDAFREEEGREPDDGRARGDHRLRAGRRPRHRAGRHPQGGPGPEHLHLLHRVLAAHDGRHPGVVHRAQGAQLLLGLDLRLPHRRGRGEPHQPARLHPRQRLHLRRELPRARHGRSTTSPPTCRSSSPTAWTPSTR